MNNRELKSKIREYTPFIKMKARMMADGEWDWEDFEQEGMIALWKALEFDPSANKSFLRQRIEWRMRDYARKIYPNKEQGFSPHHENMLYGNYGENNTGEA
jgi:DNA-directed RNA polymerase specialized sigma subunit